MTTGTDLKVARVKALVQAKCIAEMMGVSASRISHIERPERRNEALVARYLAALEECRTFGTSGG